MCDDAAALALRMRGALLNMFKYKSEFKLVLLSSFQLRLEIY